MGDGSEMVASVDRCNVDHIIPDFVYGRHLRLSTVQYHGVGR